MNEPRGSDPHGAGPAERPLQPLLHDLVSCVSAPALALSDPDGQMRPRGVQGWFRGDRRMLDELTVEVNGREPEPLRGGSRGAAAAAFTTVARHLGDPSTDPTVRLDRTRELADDRLVETVTVTSSARSGVDLRLTLRAASDLAPIAAVRSGHATTPVAPRAGDDGLVWRPPDEESPLSVTLRCDPAPEAVDADGGTLVWRRLLRGGDGDDGGGDGPDDARVLRVRVTVEVAGQEPELTAPTTTPWATPQVDCGDVRVGALVRQSLADLGGLLLRDGTSCEDDHFLAAGTPWYLTLFGRDSLWAARMLLPLGTDLALSTLRTLARRQGERDDPETEEQPGKVPHEVRAAQQVLGDMSLPPLYYGTVDATPLFVILLAQAWRHGADPDGVEEMLPHAQACLRWIEAQAGDGFIRYVDATGHGLTNQGWKDSEDGIQWADGRLAEPPIALSEVQAYAYQAATVGADLLDAFGWPGARHWRDWAARMAALFREHFWVEDDRGRYPAVALDRHGRAVDSVASNMGHLLGTGLLDPQEAALVAGRLGAEDMDSGFGLRTLTSRSPRYSALSYHGGSVWPHDTAVAVDGLRREGYPEQAAALLRGLVAAAPAFGYRLPELYSGDAVGQEAGQQAGQAAAPVPYPTACRPQAWAAAAPLWALVAVLGVDVDVPAGVVWVPARVRTGLGPLALRGLRVGDHSLDVEVSADGVVTASSNHPGIEVRTTR